MKRLWRRKGMMLMSAAMLVAPLSASGQGLVYPKLSEAGAREKYVLRVPNERDVATTRVEIRFPRSLRVVSFAEVPGWVLEVLGDSAKHVIGAVWTGSLAPKRFVEFPFIAVNPKAAVRLVWPVFQTYSSGERVDWTGKEDAKQPASVTTVQVTPARSRGALLAWWVCIAALVLSVGGLVLAIRPEGSSGPHHPGS